MLRYVDLNVCIIVASPSNDVRSLSTREVLRKRVGAGMGALLLCVV